ncbi:hypothetical protein EDD11_009700 [Mortierella claussenii]|nr:hypothetical protein EDD11_009700 [Mortierella claussenii]
MELETWETGNFRGKGCFMVRAQEFNFEAETTLLRLEMRCRIIESVEELSRYMVWVKALVDKEFSEWTHGLTTFLGFGGQWKKSYASRFKSWGLKLAGKFNCPSSTLPQVRNGILRAKGHPSHHHFIQAMLETTVDNATNCRDALERDSYSEQPSSRIALPKIPALGLQYESNEKAFEEINLWAIN